MQRSFERITFGIFGCLKFFDGASSLNRSSAPVPDKNNSIAYLWFGPTDRSQISFGVLVEINHVGFRTQFLNTKTGMTTSPGFFFSFNVAGFQEATRRSRLRRIVQSSLP